MLSIHLPLGGYSLDVDVIEYSRQPSADLFVRPGQGGLPENNHAT